MIDRLLKPFVIAPFAVLFGAAFGIFVSLSGPAFMGTIVTFHDGLFPVVTMSGRLEGVESDAAIVRIQGTKHRNEECRLIRLYGYKVDAAGKREDAIVERADLAAQPRIRTAGEYDAGTWRIRPIAPATRRVEAWAHHECFGRPVLTKIADVDILIANKGN